MDPLSPLMDAGGLPAVLRLAAHVVGLPLEQPLEQYLQQVASALVAELTQTSVRSGRGEAAGAAGVAGWPGRQG